MKLYRATITCRLKSSFLGGLPPNTLLTFQHAIAALDDAAAVASLQSTFPWSFYKNVKVSWVKVSDCG